LKAKEILEEGLRQAFSYYLTEGSCAMSMEQMMDLLDALWNPAPGKTAAAAVEGWSRHVVGCGPVYLVNDFSGEAPETVATLIELMSKEFVRSMLKAQGVEPHLVDADLEKVTDENGYVSGSIFSRVAELNLPKDSTSYLLNPACFTKTGTFDKVRM